MTVRRLAPLLPVALLFACSAGNGAENAEGPADKAAAATGDGPGETALQRVDAIRQAVDGWKGASNLAAAKRNAEAARNLVVGPDGPGYGDSDGDGTIAGENGVGLLPGLNGGKALAVPAANACVARDLLGGSWDDPARRWALMQSKIDDWRPGNNTFPSLPSHAQRVVGWATLTLGSGDLATAREFASHAEIHVNVSRRALAKREP